MQIPGFARALFNPMTAIQFAMGPAGWASLAMRTLGSQIAMNAIQRFGQQVGLPPAAIGLVQAAVARDIGLPGLTQQSMRGVVSQLADQFGLSPRDEASLQRAAEFDIKEFMKGIDEAVQRGKALGGGRKGGRSILEVIANAMISAMNSKVDQMRGLAQQMDNVKHRTGKTDSVQINTDLQVATQEFSMMMNATQNMIKTIGEGLATAARKN